MEYFISCKICGQVFDNLHSITKMLKCGHTFCSSCLIKLLQENPFCPYCRDEVEEIENSLPVNYTALEAVDFYKSKCWPERKMDIVTEVAKRKDIILKKKTQMKLNVKIFDKCLKKLNELTKSHSERIDTVNTRKILDEIDEDLKKTDDVVRSDDIKSSISILLSSFEDSEQFLLEIYKRLQNGEKVFAVHKINEEFKYGEVLVFGNQLFFYSLNSSQVPKDSSLVWFEDAKQCLNSKDFCAFIKICYNEKNFKTSFVIIETFNQLLCNQFIKLCTGECGPSYKGSLLREGNNERIKFSEVLTNVFRVEKRIKNESEKMRLKGYNRYLQKQESVSFNANEMLLYLDFNGGFDIFRPSNTFNETWKPPFGRVISPLTLYNDINYNNPSNLVLDCGIIINV
ncbi:UNVERIFIED_CONTAM: hypothetical protein RMT77_016556 [Armadillidium vulgare]